MMHDQPNVKICKWLGRQQSNMVDAVFQNFTGEAKETLKEPS
jgi:hypothetical protein